MRTFSIILADDEQNILYGMQKGINWEEPGFIVAGTAQNGKEVLEMMDDLHPDLVICNNDDMALVVYDYYKEKNLALPIILGINNSQEMNEKIMSGEIYGSVDNDMDKQVLRIVKCMESVLNGNTKKYKKVWYSTPYAVTRE